MFLIALLQAHRGGRAHVGKEELISSAEALHITDKPIRGACWNAGLGWLNALHMRLEQVNEAAHE